MSNQVRIENLEVGKIYQVNSLLEGQKDNEGNYWIYNPNNFEVNEFQAKTIYRWNPHLSYNVSYLRDVDNQ